MLLTTSTEDLECGGTRRRSPTTKRDNPLGPLECLELVELSLDLADINSKVRCDVGKGKMDVCELSLVNRGSVHPQAVAVSAPGLEVANLLILCRRRIVVDNGHATVADACSRSRSPIARHFAEVLGGATLTPDVAARVERTRIEGADVGACGRSDCPRFLWPTYRIGDGKGHWRGP